MNTIEIPTLTLTMQIPNHWDEISEDKNTDIHYCLTQAIAVSHGLQPLIAAQVKCFYRLSGIRRNWKTLLLERIKPQSWVEDKNSIITQLSTDLITFLFKPLQNGENSSPQPNLEINYNTIINHFPFVYPAVSFWKIPRISHRLYGPSDLLSNLTFGEFRAALEELEEYYFMRAIDQYTPKELHHQLSRFIACLYRTERHNYQQLSKTETFDGNRREPFNRARISVHAHHADKIDVVTRTVILLWFTYSVDYIQTQELTISGKTITLRSLFPKPTQTDQIVPDTKLRKGGSWTTILYMIAKEGLFGNAEQTDRVGLFDILIYMHDQHQEASKAKARANRKH